MLRRRRNRLGKAHLMIVFLVNLWKKLNITTITLKDFVIRRKKVQEILVTQE